MSVPAGICGWMAVLDASSSSYVHTFNKYIHYFSLITEDDRQQGRGKRHDVVSM